MGEDNESQRYEKNSLTLTGVAMGTGVMIGVGIFALTGQIAERAGRWFPSRSWRLRWWRGSAPTPTSNSPTPTPRPAESPCT